MPRKFGFGFGAGRRGRLPGGAVPTAPGTFTAGQWSIAAAGTAGNATVTIGSLPADGGSAITALQYRIGGGAWTDFVGTGTGARTIAGFTDGISTPVLVRAVNAIGVGPDSTAKSVTTTGGATAPAAMTVGQWGWAPAGSGQITVNLLTPPADGGSAITSYQYRIGAGAWTLLNAALGSWTIGGFTDGVATDLRVRAVNAIGAGPDSDVKSVTSQAGTAPSAFTVEMWGVSNRGSGTALIGIQFLPAAGSSRITRLDYRVNGGAWQTLTTSPRIAEYTITGLVDGAYRNIEIRASSAVGDGATSDVKKVWTGVGVMPQVAYFGAKTIAGAGGFRPLDHTGTPVDLIASPAPSPATSGAYTANITTNGPGTGLTFTGAAGAPNGVTFTVAHAGGTVAIEIQTIANMWHVSSIGQASSVVAAGAFTLGDHVRFRAGLHNPTAAVSNVHTARHTPGTWTGAGNIKAGNWVVFTRDPCHLTQFGSIAFGQGGNQFRRYWRLHDVDCLSPMTANPNGGGGNGAQIMLEAAFFNETHFAATNCRLTHTATVTGATVASTGNGNIGPYQAIRCNSGPYWIEGNTINGCWSGIDANTGNSTERSFLQGNSVRRCLVDAYLIGTCTGLRIEGNISTDKLHGHFPRTPIAVTRGASTTFTVSALTPLTPDWTVPEGFIMYGFTGAFAPLNGTYVETVSVTATTVTVGIDTSALAEDLTGTITCTNSFHGDHLQFSEGNGLDRNQSDVWIRFNRFTAGVSDGHFTPSGGTCFGGNSTAGSGTTDRYGWRVECNIFETPLAQGFSLSNFYAGVVRNNTIVRQIGMDASTTDTQAAQIIIANGAGNILRDNLVTGTGTLAGVIENTNTVPITLTVPRSRVPALTANIDLYNSHFVSPPTAADTVYDAVTAFAIRTSGGAQGSPAFFAGAHYCDFDLMTYTPPRPATAPVPFIAGMWSIADAVTTGDAIVTITDLPFDGDSPITALQYSIAGGAWTAFSGSTRGAYSIPGFTDGVATNVQIRAVNAVGAAAVSDTKSVTTSAPSAPAAFTAGQWSWADAVAGGQADVTISTLPSANGSPITALQYSIGGGAWTAFSGITTGTYRISGFTDGNATNLNIRAVNAIGSGATSDTKSVTTSAPTGIVHVATGATVEQASGTTLTVPLATNIAGDLLVLAISYDQGNNPTTPAGWTLAHTVVAFTANVPDIKIYTKISSGSEGPNIAVTVPNRSHIGVTASFRLPNATPLGNVSTANVFSSTTRSSPSVTATANSIILHVYSWWPGGSLAFVATPPPVATQMVSLRSTVKNGGMWLGWEKRISAGATSTRTLTVDVSNGMAGGQVELRSA